VLKNELSEQYKNNMQLTKVVDNFQNEQACLRQVLELQKQLITVEEKDSVSCLTLDSRLNIIDKLVVEPRTVRIRD
jgi:hypothetical protein